MDNKKQHNIMSVESLITLCHILDDYKQFDKNLRDQLTEKNCIKISNDLSKLLKNEKPIRGKTAKNIYNENKKVIDTINKYTNIGSFLYYNDNWHILKDYERTESYDLDYFYHYFQNNRDKLDQIKELLNQIKYLGIQKLEFNENFDFTNNIYELSTIFQKNSDIHYLENITIIPNYEDEVIKYKTTDSNYDILTHPGSRILTKENNTISSYGLEIKVNNLFFNPNKLPEHLNISTVFNRILYLKRRVQKDCDNIKGAVDLSINIDNLKETYNDITNCIMEIDDLEHKEFLGIVLRDIENRIHELEDVNNEFRNKIIKNNPNITEEKIEKEKTLKRKKEDSSLFFML